MGKIRSLLKLSRNDQRLVVEASMLLLFFRITLWIAPFSRVRHLAANLAQTSMTRPFSRGRICWVVDAAASFLHISNCLARALAGHVLLRRSGHSAVIRIGMNRERDGRFVAHAWVEASDGSVLVGGGEEPRFRTAIGPGRIV